MKIPNFPKWIWIIIGIVAILILLAVCRVNVSIGSNGFHITQGLVQ